MCGGSNKNPPCVRIKFVAPRMGYLNLIIVHNSLLYLHKYYKKNIQGELNSPKTFLNRHQTFLNIAVFRYLK